MEAAILSGYRARLFHQASAAQVYATPNFADTDKSATPGTGNHLSRFLRILTVLVCVNYVSCRSQLRCSFPNFGFCDHRNFWYIYPFRCHPTWAFITDSKLAAVTHSTWHRSVISPGCRVLWSSFHRLLSHGKSPLPPVYIQASFKFSSIADTSSLMQPALTARYLLGNPRICSYNKKPRVDGENSSAHTSAFSYGLSRFDDVSIISGKEWKQINFFCRLPRTINGLSFGFEGKCRGIPSFLMKASYDLNKCSHQVITPNLRI